MKILALDDDKFLLSILEDMLNRNDNQVVCIDNAKQAIAMVQNDHYDFVLVDYKMPGNDGIWFMENANLPRHTKVILMTAYADRNLINKMFTLGISGYIIKPFDEEELIRNMTFHSK